MEKKDFKVRVLSQTNPNDMVDIFVKSRPSLLHKEGDYIVDNLGEPFTIEEYKEKLVDFDLSLSYFETYNLEIESSILIRDFFYSFNSKARWAFTHRNGMPETLYSSSECYNEKEQKMYENFESKIKEWKDGEIDFDTARQEMPLSLSTMWHIQLSAKEIVRILGYLHYYIGETQMFHVIWTEFSKIIPRWIHLLRKYDHDSYTEGYSEPIITRKIGFNLYAQLIRHEDVYVSGIGEFLKQYNSTKFNPANRKCKSLINVAISVSEQRWRQIIKTRTAWFSMTDNWGDRNSWSIFLKDYITGDLHNDIPYLKYFDESGEFDDSSIRAYAIDDNLRVRKGKTPYFPDAFALESRDIILERIKARGDNPLFQDYLQIFDKGFINDNPENPLRKKWEELRSVPQET